MEGLHLHISISISISPSLISPSLHISIYRFTMSIAMAASDRSKLRVLCFHGFRTSAHIFKKQICRWDSSILDLLDLVSSFHINFSFLLESWAMSISRRFRLTAKKTSFFLFFFYGSKLFFSSSIKALLLIKNKNKN